MSPLNIPGWRDFPLRRRLAEALGVAVHIDNDAKALALGEGWRGAARGERDFIAMVVSTGVGGGIVLDGRLLDGADGNAGHIGHVIVEPDGRLCACGGQGCLEAEASGHGHRGAHRAHRRRRRPPRSDAGPVAWSAGPSARRRPCSTCGWPWSPARWRSATATTFFAAAQAELDRTARIEFARGATIRPGRPRRRRAR